MTSLASDAKREILEISSDCSTAKKCLERIKPNVTNARAESDLEIAISELDDAVKRCKKLISSS